MGPGIGIVEFAATNDKGNGVVDGVLAAAALAMLAGFAVLLASADRARTRSGRRASYARAVAVIVIGGAWWALPGSWSIPSSVFAFPWDWLALSVPFPLVALAVQPGATRWRRALVAAPLLVTALAWPTLCSSAAATIRARAGVSADRWFVVRVDGYVAQGYTNTVDGVPPELDYHRKTWDVEYGDDLILRSWPADAATPCGWLQGFASSGGWSCGPDRDGMWAAEDEKQDRFLVRRYGAWYVAAEVPGDAQFPIPAECLPGILASVHPADVHEQLAMANGY